MPRQGLQGRARACLAVGLIGIQVWQPVLAGVVARNPQITQGQAANGVPVVNIATPGQSGISHNTYTRFDVDRQGLILNNSGQPVNTQLGGYIPGNANLHSGSARLILNEVSGNLPSQLKGYMEIAGQKAEMIIANPAGITCNGCGFINTSRGTLTTGKPLFGNDGSLSGFRVEDGILEIDGLGLNASNTDRLNLYSRALVLNADLHARDLSVVTGTNNVNVINGAITPVASTTTAPAFSIDSSSLGGMYANRIRLVGTEAGLGMRLAAPVAAMNGNLEINSNGDVMISRSSSLHDTNIASTGKVRINGQTAAGGELEIIARQLELTALAQVNSGKTLFDADEIDVAANSQVATDGLLRVEADRISNAGDIGSASSIQVNTRTLTNTGNISAGTDLTMIAEGLVNRGNISSLDGDLRIDVSESLDNQGGQLLSDHNMSLSMPTFDQVAIGGLLQAYGEMAITANENILFSGDIFQAPGSLQLTAGGRISINNRLAVDDDILMHADVISVYQDGWVLANGDADFQARQLINNGVILGRKSLSAKIDELLDNRGTYRISEKGNREFLGAMLLSEGDIRLEGDSGDRIVVLNNIGSQIESLSGSIYLKADTLNNHNEGWSLSPVLKEAMETVYSDACNKYCGEYEHIWDQMFDGEFYCCYVAGGNNPAPILYESTFYDRGGKRFENVWLYRTRNWIIHRDVADLGHRAGITANKSANGNGGNIWIEASVVDNDRSSISAAATLTIEASEIRNTATRLHDSYERLQESRKKSCDSSDCDPQDGPTTHQTGDFESRPDQIISSVLEGSEVNLNGTDVIWNSDGEEGEVIRAQTIVDPQGPWAQLPDMHPDPDNGALDPTTLPGFRVPNGGLFQRVSGPGHPYLIETDPALNTYQGFLGSGYLLSHLEWSPEVTQRRLGDSYYELMLIRQALLASIGSRFLDASIADERQQFEYLMQNAVAASESLQLSPGVSLTRNQIDALQQDIIWLEEKVVLDERVLVPVVYLAQGSSRLLANGAVIGGGTVNVDGEHLHNSGLIRADDVLAVQMRHTIENRGGSLQSNADLMLASGGDILNESGRIAGHNVLMAADGDITHRTWSEREQHQGSNSQSWSTRVGDQASVVASGQMLQQAGGNLSLMGASVEGGVVALAAGNNLIIDTVRLDQGYNLRDGDLHQAEAYTRHLTSQVSALQDLQLQAGADLIAIAADIRAGASASLEAGANLLLLAAENTDHYEYHSEHDGSMGRSRSRDSVHDETRLLGTTISVGHADNPVAEPGHLTLAAGKDITLYASQVVATGQVDVTAGDSLNLIAGINAVSHSERSSEENAATYRNKDQGYINQTAAASVISAGGDLNLNAANDIRLTASILHSGQTLRIGEESVDPAALTANSPQRPMNVIVDTLALTNESWNETEKGFKGPLKELVKGLSLILTPKLEILSLGLIDLPETEIASFSRSRTTNVLQAGSFLQANNISINATDTVAMINANVAAEGIADISANDIIIAAIAETHTAMHDEGSETVNGLGMRLDKDEVRVAGVEMIKHSLADSTTMVEWKGSTINADQLVLNAKRDLEILGASINVSGDAMISAGNQLTVGGHEAIQTQESKDITDVTTVSASVRNAYLDAALAVKAMAEAVAGIKEAKRALADAEGRADRGELDPDDVKFFQMNLAAATANLVQMEIAMAAALAMGAATAGTGFYASGSAQREKTVTTSTITQGIWQGSNITVGGNAMLVAGEKIKVQGSDVSVRNTLVVNADKIVLLAGEEHSSSKSKTVRESQGVSISATGGGVNVGTHQTDADSLGTHYINTHLNSGEFFSTSGSLQLAGAIIEADSVGIKTGKLSVVSLQDTFDSKSKSLGGNIGISGGSGGLTGGSIAADFQKSETERKWVEEQSGIIGHNSINITAEDTLLTGAIIANASRDAGGGLVDQGQLHLKTNTLTIANLYDVDKTKTVGANLAVGIKVDGGGKSHGSESNAPIGNTSTGAAAEARKGGVPVDSITVGGLYNGHVTERTTFATLGMGHIEVGGETLTEENSATLVRSPNGALLNRDVANTQLITKDQDIGGLNASVTVDGRWFSQAGREEIYAQQRELGKNLEINGLAIALGLGAVVGQASGQRILDAIDKYQNPKLYQVMCLQQPCTYIQGAEGEDDPNRLLAQTEIATGHEISAPNIQYIPVSLEDVSALNDDQKMNFNVADNGIFNKAQRAAELAIQQVPLASGESPVKVDPNYTPGPTFLVHTDEADTKIGELFLAGMANINALKQTYTPAAILTGELVKVLSTRSDRDGDGKTNISGNLIGHSRGTYTAASTLSYLKDKNFLNQNLAVYFNNPAATPEIIDTASIGIVSPNMIHVWAPPTDPITYFVGRHPGSFLGAMKEIPIMKNTPHSAHSCPGTGAVGCLPVNVPVLLKPGINVVKKAPSLPIIRSSMGE